jgi:threonyl-tRNA synthetase
LPGTEYIKAVKLLSIAGAYWRGDEKRKQLTRVYGITFPKQSMLDEYLEMLEQAKLRDHRKLGKELELFYVFSVCGAGTSCMAAPRGKTQRETGRILKKGAG